MLNYLWYRAYSNVNWKFIWFHLNIFYIFGNFKIFIRLKVDSIRIVLGANCYKFVHVYLIVLYVPNPNP